MLNPFLGKFPADPCAPAWAMTTFLLGYLMNAAMVPALARLSAGRLKFWLGVTLAALTLRGFIAGWATRPDAPPYPMRVDTPLTEYLHIFPAVRLPDILAGTLCGILAAKGIATEKPARRPTPIAWETALVAIWATCTALCMKDGRTAFAATHGLLAIPLGCWLLRSTKSKGGFFDTLGGPIRRHADIAAELYLLHTFVASVFYRFLWVHFGVSSHGKELPMAIIAAISTVLAALAVKYVSRKFSSDRLLKKRSGEAVPVPSV